MGCLVACTSHTSWPRGTCTLNREEGGRQRRCEYLACRHVPHDGEPFTLAYVAFPPPPALTLPPSAPFRPLYSNIGDEEE